MTAERVAWRVASGASGVWVRALKLGTCVGVGALTVASIAFANPQGGEVVSGQATISTPNAATTQIVQESDKAVVNWQSFNIQSHESTVFIQPNASSVTLNRIFDNNPSVIAGLLTSNGRLILINRNGMVFENGASVNAAGLIATTADMNNDAFMAGRYEFDTPGNPNAQISNAGTITAEQGGVVAFVAPSVKNSGVITAKLGRVELGAGNTFVLDLYGDNLISFPISAELAQQLIGADGQPLSTLVDMSGRIEAGTVRLTARAARDIIDSAINISGEIIASGAQQTGNTVTFSGTREPTFGRDVFAGAQSQSSGSASAPNGPGGAIVVDGGASGAVTIGGSLTASGTTGGSISVNGENVHASGSLTANGTSGKGGNVAIAASNYSTMTGSVSANGSSGGSVNVTARDLVTAGAISANGTNGAGGNVSLSAANRHIATTATQVSANGTNAGGSVTVSGGSGEDGGLFTSGNYNATASSGTGGNVTVGGRDIKLIDTHVDVSGAKGGGNVAVGFSGQGASRSIGADNILVSPTSTFKADATTSGNGGSVIFWSNLASDFMGTITAKGGSLSGNGGSLEVSSKGDVGFWGLGDASAAHGLAGTLALDPKNLIVSATGSTFPSYQLIDPNATAGNLFGGSVAALTTGNTVVTASQEDLGATNAGAVYVFNTVTGALISTLTGSHANDQIGNGGITLPSNEGRGRGSSFTE